MKTRTALSALALAAASLTAPLVVAPPAHADSMVCTPTPHAPTTALPGHVIGTGGASCVGKMPGVTVSTDCRLQKRVGRWPFWSYRNVPLVEQSLGSRPCHAASLYAAGTYRTQTRVVIRTIRTAVVVHSSGWSASRDSKL